MIIWIRRQVAYDRCVGVFEVGLVDDPRCSALLFADIRGMNVTLDMVARMDSGMAVIPSEIWHRILACGHSRVIFRQFCTMDSVVAIRRGACPVEGSASEN